MDKDRRGTGEDSSFGYIYAVKLHVHQSAMDKNIPEGGRLTLPAPPVSPHLNPNIKLSNFSNVVASYSLTRGVNHVIDWEPARAAQHQPITQC